MGRVILVRHGQASFFGASYDRLSPLGREQARALGDHWARHGVAFDRVYVGPRTRHRETCELVAEAYAQRGLPWPRAIELPELDEHHGLTVIKHQLGRTDLDNDALHPGEVGDGEREHAIRQFFRHYLEIMREWARGSITVAGVEPWSEFRARALRVLDLLCTAPGPDAGGAGAVAFTSGGLVSFNALPHLADPKYATAV